MNDLRIGDHIRCIDPQFSGHDLTYEIERFIGDDDSNESDPAYKNEALSKGYKNGDIIARRIDGQGRAAFKRQYVNRLPANRPNYGW